MTFATVLKTGGIYRAEHVASIQAQVSAHYRGTHRHLCLTDDPAVEGVVIPLHHGWPGWWSKLELFEHDLGRVVYLDLDVVVRAPIDWIDDLALSDGVVMYGMRDAMNPILNSSFMFWSGKMDHIAAGFSTDLPHEETRGTDQRWIFNRIRRAHGNDSVRLLEPPMVGSFKKHGEASAAIVVYHGPPKPWDHALVEKWRIRHAKQNFS